MKTCTHLQSQVFKLLAHALEQVHMAARNASRLRRDLEAQQKTLRELEEKYPEWLVAGRGVSLILLILMVLAVLGMDLYFFGVASAYLASSLSGVPWASASAPALVPLLVVTLDLALGYRIHKSPRQRKSLEKACCGCGSA